MGKEAHISKAQCSYGKIECRCSRYKCEGICALPGDTLEWIRLLCAKESAAIIVIQDYLDEGSNLMLRPMGLLLTSTEIGAEADFEISQTYWGGITRKVGGIQ